MMSFCSLVRQEDPAVAKTNPIKHRLPKECVIKVYKNTTESETGEEEQRLIEAKREMTHLNRMARAGIPCPQVQFLHEHILVTDFVGRDGQPAKKLKNATELNNQKGVLKSAYEQVINVCSSHFNSQFLYLVCHITCYHRFLETLVSFYRI